MAITDKKDWWKNGNYKIYGNYKNMAVEISEKEYVERFPKGKDYFNCFGYEKNSEVTFLDNGDILFYSDWNGYEYNDETHNLSYTPVTVEDPENEGDFITIGYNN